MRPFQLTAKTKLVAGDGRQREEAILKVASEQAAVLLFPDRPSLGVEQTLYSVDDFNAMGQE
jgi:hypothetical protein